MRSDNGREHRVQANTIEILKIKCAPYIKKPHIHTIEVQKVVYQGYFKLPGDLDLGEEMLWRKEDTDKFIVDKWE